MSVWCAVLMAVSPKVPENHADHADHAAREGQCSKLLNSFVLGESPEKGVAKFARHNERCKECAFWECYKLAWELLTEEAQIKNEARLSRSARRKCARQFGKMTSIDKKERADFRTKINPPALLE